MLFSDSRSISSFDAPESVNSRKGGGETAKFKEKPLLLWETGCPGFFYGLPLILNSIKNILKFKEDQFLKQAFPKMQSGNYLLIYCNNNKQLFNFGKEFLTAVARVHRRTKRVCL